MKKIVYLGVEDVAIVLSAIKKTIIMKDGNLYTSDASNYPGEIYTTEKSDDTEEQTN